MIYPWTLCIFYTPALRSTWFLDGIKKWGVVLMYCKRDARDIHLLAEQAQLQDHGRTAGLLVDGLERSRAAR